MKFNLMFSPVFFISFIGIFCFAGDDISAKVTDEAIDKRIAKIRKGNIIVNTEPGAEVKIERDLHPGGIKEYQVVVICALSHVSGGIIPLLLLEMGVVLTQ